MKRLVLLSMFVLLGVGWSSAAAQTKQGGDTAPSNPELVNALAKELGSTPAQAEGAAGAVFSLAKSKMQPADWGKVAGAVPGIDGLLKAAPALGAATGGAIPGGAALGGLSSLAGAFSKLGLKPELALKAVPIITQFVTKSGGAEIGKLLASVLK